MNNLPNKFDIQIEDLFNLVPETIFTSEDINLVNYLNFLNSDPKSILAQAISFAQNNNFEKLKKISFFTEDYIPRLVALGKKINNQNIQDFLQISTYAFNDEVTVELNENLQPINQNNILKIQAVELGCVPHKNCTIIVPSEVDPSEVLMSLPTSIQKENVSIDNRDVFQYYMDNTSIQQLLKIQEPAPVEVFSSKIDLFSVFKLDSNKKEDVLHFFNTLQAIGAKKSNNLELLSVINPDITDKTLDTYFPSIQKYFGDTIQINKRFLSEILLLNESFLNDPEVAQSTANLLSTMPYQKENFDFTCFFDDSSFGHSLTAKTFLDNLNNSAIFFKASPDKLGLFSTMLHDLVSSQDTTGQLFSSTLIGTDVEIAPSIKMLPELLNISPGSMDSKKFTYIQKVLENLQGEIITPSLYPTTLALYPFLSEEKRSNSALVIGLAEYASHITPKVNGGGTPTSQKIIQSSIDAFFKHIPVHIFKHTYTSFHKNNSFPQSNLACLFEIETVLAEILSKTPVEFSSRSFQSSATWKKFISAHGLKTILNDTRHNNPISEKHLPILHKLGNSNSHKPFLHFFNKFVEDYLPSQEKGAHNNQIFVALSHYISTVYEKEFNKDNISMTPENAITFERLFQFTSDDFKAKIIHIIGDLDWHPEDEEHQILFKNLVSKLGKRNIINLSKNPNIHHFFKHPDTISWLVGRAIFTNGINENNELPLQHIFSIQDVENLYKTQPDKEFIKISPFTFVVLAPMEYKLNSQLWIDLIEDKTKTSILQFLPVSIKNNPDTLLKMLKIAPAKTQALLNNFSESSVNNISVFLQALENAESHYNIQSFVFSKYRAIIQQLAPTAKDFQSLETQDIKIACEELLMTNVIPVNKTSKSRTNKF